MMFVSEIETLRKKTGRLAGGGRRRDIEGIHHTV